MVRKSDEERLAELEARKARVEGQMRRIKSKQRERDRRHDTRRKVLAGAAVLARAERDPQAMADLRALLDRFLERPQDRAVFGLEPRTEGRDTNQRPAGGAAS